MSTKGKTSEVGEDRPTEKTNQKLEDLVSDVLDSPAAPPKSTLEKEPEEDLKQDEEEDLGEEPDAPKEEEEDAPKKETQEEDEVVPASKHKKVLEKMQKRIDQLVAEREAQKASESSKAKTQDEKLAALNNHELTELRDNVEEAIIDAKVTAKTDGTDMTDRLAELRTLKRSIESTIKTAPVRFNEKQVSHLNEMAETVKDIDPDVVDRKGELWETAKRIYSRMPSLHSSETGQAEALAIATEYYLEKKTLEGGKERSSTLQRKVESLKKKTSLDRKVHVANADSVSTSKMREKAIRGTYDDKLSFIKNTLVPDEYFSEG